MQNMPHIASRVLNTPLLLEPGYARTFFSALAPRLGIAELHDASGEVLTGETMRMRADRFASSRDRERPFELVNGVAVLPVSGSLVHKYGHLKPYSGMTGYDGIIKRAAEAFSDPDVKGVMLDNDTPGGEVSGCFNASRKLREMADQAGKQLWALAYDMNCSAGMALASSAHRRLVTETGVVGSVGVVMAHASFEKHLEEEGIKVTLIHSGANKVDGNPYEDLPSEVLKSFQESTDQLRLEFAQLVAGHMNLTVEDVLATEAAVYRGKAALDVRFADELVNGLDAVGLFSDHLSTQGRTITLGANMSLEPEAKVGTPETPSPAAEASTAEETKPEVTAADAAKAEQARISGILQSEAAQGREATANHLAFSTAMSVEEAAAILATMPEAATGVADMETSLDKAMANEKQPEIGADVSEDAEASEADRMTANWQKATGRKPE